MDSFAKKLREALAKDPKSVVRVQPNDEMMQRLAESLKHDFVPDFQKIKPSEENPSLGSSFGQISANNGDKKNGNLIIGITDTFVSTDQPSIENGTAEDIPADVMRYIKQAIKKLTADEQIALENAQINWRDSGN